MKLTKKLLALMLSVIFVVCAFSGCSSADSEEKNIEKGDTTSKVAILQYMPHSSLDNCTQGVKNALTAADIECVVQIGSSGSADSDCQSYAQQLASAGYDAIVAVATPAATAAYSAVINAGTDIPVIFCAVSDPVSAGLVESMEAPGSNCTGTADAFDIEGQVDIILQLQPDIKSLGVLYTTSEANSISQLKTLQAECDKAGITLEAQGISEAAELASAAVSLVSKVDAITNLTDNNVVDNMSVVLEQAEAAGIPVYGSEIEQVKKGCLASASIDYVALGEKTGEMCADILKNGKSAKTYPAVTVTDSFLVANTDVAEKLNITIPEELEIEKVTTTAE